LVSENKTHAHPASADNVTTSADQEDHVSMANFAARKLRLATVNTERVLGIELYTAAQGREFHKELRAGAGAQAAYEFIRKHIKPLQSDRYMADELDLVTELVASGAIRRAAEKACGALRV
jgi:histidine ammonia-lyase